jgi:hypothetical protein
MKSASKPGWHLNSELLGVPSPSQVSSTITTRGRRSAAAAKAQQNDLRSRVFGS